MNNKAPNFGPWTTSLDSGSRLQLSAFWKQRMRRLPSLASTVRMSRWSMAAVLVLATIISLSPLVELVPAAPTDATAEGDFVARFPNGVTVELVGVSENPSADAPWWRPDGTPLEKRPYQNVRARMGSANSLPREFCWRWRGVEGDIQTGFGIEPAYNAMGGGLLDDERKGLNAKAISLAGSPETCIVKLSMSVPATPWETQIQGQAGYSSSTGKSLPNGKTASVSYTPARADNTDTVVSVGYQTTGEVRLAALDFDGQLHVGTFGSRSGAGGFMLGEVRFANVKPKELKTWQLQTRQRKTETVEFRNVSLHRGKVTDVEAVMVEKKLPRPADQPAAKEFPRLEFGVVVERTINDDNPEQGEFMIDLDTGRILDAPEQFQSQQQLIAWLERNGIDAIGEVKQSFKGLYGFDMVAIPNGNWQPPLNILAQVDFGKPGSPVPISGQGTLPATYLFKTREGNRGVLQILEIVDDQAVKIRYKLLELSEKE